MTGESPAPTPRETPPPGAPHALSARAKAAIVESVRIVVVAACIAVSAGILRGVPDVVALRGDDPATCGAPVAARPEIQWIEQDEARALVGDGEVTFVDARPPSVYEAGHVAGALNVPMETGVIDPRATELVRGSRVVIAYCDTSGECASSKRLAGLLAAAGLPDVRVLRGGMPAWLDNEYPAEAGPCRVCP